MRITAFIEQPEVIEKILTHLGIWQRVLPRAGPPSARGVLDARHQPLISSIISS